MNGEQAKEWLHFAKIDLVSTEKLLDDEFLTRSVAFHAHQCIEKSFKAILEAKGLDVPRTHDLERLYGLIEEIAGMDLKVDEDLLDQLNDVYVDSRYPGALGLLPQGDPSIEKAREFYGFAEGLFHKIARLLEAAPRR